MPTCTNDWSTDSRWRGGRPWRVASVLAEIGRRSVCNATSTTAAIARSPLRGSRDISKKKTSGSKNGSRCNSATSRTGSPSVCSGGPESPLCARSRLQRIDFDKFDALHRRGDQLRDPHSAADHERLGAKIYKNDL